MEDAAIRGGFVTALREHRDGFGLDVSDQQVSRVADYYDLVRVHNPILHLVGPATPEVFAIRHVLESLTLLEFLPVDARFADIGTGAGLPSVLREVAEKCELAERVTLIDRQFAETPRPVVGFVTCRALDRFAQNLPRLVKWSGDATLLFFGGPSLRDQLSDLGVEFIERLMPMSEQRYLFISTKK
jgi:16S rRNA G527 N7-methylase RsmG